MSSIGEIRQEFEQTDASARKSLYEKYAEDTRAGVRSLILKYQKQEEKLQQERGRREIMRKYERQYGDVT